LLLPGKGVLHEKYQEQIKKMGIENHVKLLGFREDIPDLLKMADLLVASSLTEGLPINMIEAMITGLPVVATKVRGHVDLIENGVNGFIFEVDMVDDAVNYINRLYNDNAMYNDMRMSMLDISKKYNVDVVKEEYLALLKSLF
jgi:glycosyltransferase EpsD